MGERKLVQYNRANGKFKEKNRELGNRVIASLGREKASDPTSKSLMQLMKLMQLRYYFFFARRITMN